MATRTGSPSRTVGIGAGAPLSGPSAQLGREMTNAVRLAIDEANEAGTLPCPVTLYSLDDESDTQKGRMAAARFCAQHDILGVVGHYNSHVTIAASTVYHECGLAMITPIASNPMITERALENVFRFTNRDDRTGEAIAGYIAGTLKKRKAAIFESLGSVYGKSMSDSFSRAFAAAGGEVLARKGVTLNETDFPLLAATLPKDAEVVFYGGTFEGASILKAMREAGISTLFAAGDGCWDVANFLEPAGDSASAGEGVLVLSATPEIGGVEGSKEFGGRYERRFGPITNYAVNSYDSARCLLAAIGNAAAQGSLNRRAVIADLRANPYQGIAYPKPVTWTSKGDNASAITALHVVRQGRFHQVAQIDAREAELKVA